MTGRWSKYRELPIAERRMVRHAWLILVAVRAGIWLLPFGRLRRILDRRLRRGSIDESSRMSVHSIVRAVKAVGRFVPGASTCLPQALAAQDLLARHGHDAELRLGVARSEEQRFRAHAWIECGGEVVIGERELKRFTPIEPHC